MKKLTVLEWKKVREGKPRRPCMLNRNADMTVPAGLPTCSDEPTEVWELGMVEYSFCAECRRRICGLTSTEKRQHTIARKSLQTNILFGGGNDDGA